MNTLLIGNIIAFIGAMIMVGIGLIKKKERILIAQCFQFAMMGAANLILGGVSGFIADVISIVRNLTTYRFRLTIPLKLLFIFLQLVLTAFFNSNGLIGWLPAIAAAAFTWVLDSENIVLIKGMIILTQVMWGIFDLTIRNYVSFAFDAMTVLSTIIGIQMILKARSGDKKTE